MARRSAKGEKTIPADIICHIKEKQRAGPHIVLKILDFMLTACFILSVMQAQRTVLEEIIYIYIVRDINTDY